MIYLDYHSTTPVDKRVLNKMLPYFSIKYNNPHSQLTKHNSSIIKDIEKARLEIAKLIGAEKDEIVFTSGATESVHLAILGITSTMSPGRIIISSVEHPSVVSAANMLYKKGC